MECALFSFLGIVFANCYCFQHQRSKKEWSKLFLQSFSMDYSFSMNCFKASYRVRGKILKPRWENYFLECILRTIWSQVPPRLSSNKCWKTLTNVYQKRLLTNNKNDLKVTFMIFSLQKGYKTIMLKTRIISIVALMPLQKISLMLTSQKSILPTALSNGPNAL